MVQVSACLATTGNWRLPSQITLASQRDPVYIAAMSTAAPANAHGNHRTALWDSLLGAELNVLYWGFLSDRYAALDKAFKIIIAAAATGSAFASLTIWKQHPATWECIVTVSAVAALLHPYICDSDGSRRMSELVAVWKEVGAEYSLLWEFDDDLSKPTLSTKYQEMKHRESKIDDTKLPKSTRLLEKAYQQVLAKRGLNA